MDLTVFTYIAWNKHMVLLCCVLIWYRFDIVLRWIWTIHLATSLEIPSPNKQNTYVLQGFQQYDTQLPGAIVWLPRCQWSISHDDVIKWKHFPRYWPFVRGIHRSPVNSPHKGQWRGALMFSLIFAWINGWVNNREAGDLRRHRAHYDVTVMGTDKIGRFGTSTKNSTNHIHSSWDVLRYEDL